MYCTLTVLIKCSLGHNFFLLVVFQDFFEKEIWLVGCEKKCKDPFLQTLNVTVIQPLNCIQHPKRFITDSM